MADNKEPNALVGIASIVISPMLIMLMVGSLVYFLIEVLYRGQYSARLIWTFFFFTMGAVLIARITIEQGRHKGMMYAAGLGGACFFAMMSFVDYTGPMKAFAPLINLILMAVVWFAADRLTWDCTHFDDARTASGRGVLAAAGLDDVKAKDEPDDEVVLDPKKTANMGWLERFEAYRAERKKRPHTPGVRVLYFGLAALPLFALGQATIPADDAARRSATFTYMAIYIASTLALLGTTSLMGLSRYLEERGATVSNKLTLSWLGTGAAMILAFLVIGAFLPRPHSETPLVDLGTKRKGDRQASKNAQVRDGESGKGQGAAGQKKKAGDGKQNGKNGEQGGSSGEKNSGGGQGKSDGGKQKNDDKSGSQGDKKGNNDQSEGKSKEKTQTDNKNKQDKNAGQPTSEDQQEQQDKQSSEQGEASDDDADEGEQDEGSEESISESKLSQAMESIGSFVKWLVWIVIAVAVVAAVVYFIVKGLAPFTNWAKSLLDWWRSLFQRRARSNSKVDDEPAPKKEEKQWPAFASFRNPFAQGKSPTNLSETVHYTFAALESWAWERGLERQEHETPTEFVVRLSHDFESLEEAGFESAQVYLRVLYDKKRIRTADLKPIEMLWDKLERIPLNARRSKIE